ncbi:MAG: HepT-like ribonuclease domain-containing protein [Myxococcota bacterium]
MRDKLIHFYFGVRLEIVWIVATKEIAELEDKIEKILKNEDK